MIRILLAALVVVLAALSARAGEAVVFEWQPVEDERAVTYAFYEKEGDAWRRLGETSGLVFAVEFKPGAPERTFAVAAVADGLESVRSDEVPHELGEFLLTVKAGSTPETGRSYLERHVTLDGPLGFFSVDLLNANGKSLLRR